MQAITATTKDIDALRIDRHALNRMYMVERLAAVAIARGFTPADIVNQHVRYVLTTATGDHPSPTVWAMLVIRLGGTI